MKPQTSVCVKITAVAYFISSDEIMMITCVKKVHCKIVFQFDCHTGGPYLTLLGKGVLSFRSRDVNFFEVNIPCIFILYSGGYNPALM